MGNYYSILGLSRDNGKENGSYYLGFEYGKEIRNYPIMSGIAVSASG